MCKQCPDGRLPEFPVLVGNFPSPFDHTSVATRSTNAENISKKSPQMVDFLERLNIIKINRTQHASQRCGPRWVF